MKNVISIISLVLIILVVGLVAFHEHRLVLA